MSIVDSATERSAAEGKLAGATIEDLRRDLEYWTLAGHDYSAEFNDLLERRVVVQGLYQEATTWVSLIAEELGRRRDARRTG